MSCKKNYTCTLKLENLIIHGYPLSVLRAVYKSACTNAKFKGSLGKTSVSDLIAMPLTMVKISDCSLNQYATCSTYKIMWSKRLVGKTLWNAQFSQRITCFVYSFWLIRISGWYIERDDMVCYAVIVLQRSGVLQYNIYTVAYSIGW